MAIIYRTKKNGVDYQVRTAGASIRLYSNDAFHSQYNPEHLFSGAVWDLLALPALVSSQFPKKVLVLGVGGGAVINQLHQLGSPETVVGIELDPNHIRIARRFFRVTQPGVSLIEADAYDWVSQQTERYDYIIDDVFLHTDADPERPFPVSSQWNKKLAARLTKYGVLVQNHINPDQLRAAKETLHPLFGSVYQFTTGGYDNQVLACFKTEVSGLRQSLTKQLLDLPGRKTARLRYHCAQVK